MSNKVIRNKTQEESQLRGLWRWCCQNCGNKALIPWDKGRPTSCHQKCSEPNWKLLKHQEQYEDGKGDWTHPLGEI